MVFSSLFFTFVFLPVTVLLYYLAGRRLRNTVLLVASLFFYAWGEPVYVLLMCGSIMLNYFIGLLLGRGDTSGRTRMLFLIMSLVINLSCLAYFKYSGMIAGTMASIGDWHLGVKVPVLPIGISFYTFQILSYVIDVYRKKIRPQKNLLRFALYITMFPQLVAGPIVNYSDIESQLMDRSLSLRKFNSGMQRFLYGLAKKVFLANNIGLLWSEVRAMPDANVSVIMAWAGIIAFTLQIYFDFSGYSDMAIGLGKMLGFRFKENFRYPYTSQSISEFWRRWHISLGSWFREYVYIPLGGSRVSIQKLVLNLFVVWFLTGLWHGASWNFVLWGLYFGVLIFIEKAFLQKSMAKWPRAFRHIYTLFLVVIGWVFFEFTNTAEMFNFLRVMFGAGGNAFIDDPGIVKLKAYTILYVVCIIAASPWPRRLAASFGSTHRDTYRFAVNAYCCVLMLLSTTYMVGSTYNPFIYFRF